MNEDMDEWHSGGSWSGSEETLVGYGGPIEQENHRNVRPATVRKCHLDNPQKRLRHGPTMAQRSKTSGTCFQTRRQCGGNRPCCLGSYQITGDGGDAGFRRLFVVRALNHR